MSRVLDYILRFAVILVGYAVATLAASAFVHLLFLGAAGFQPDESSAYVVGPLLFSIPFTALFVGYFAFLPSVVMILIGEVLGQRNWLFYALSGAAVGLAVIALFWQSPMEWDVQTNAEITFGTSRFVGLMIGGGIVGGLAYWLCAGRFAGNWRDRPTSSGPSIS
jgi:hypothetical protein